MLSYLFPVKPNEWKSVSMLFLLMAVISLGSTIARSVGMTLLVGNLGKESLPIVFVCIDLSVMFGSFFYASYSQRWSPVTMFITLLAAAAGFTIVVRFLFFAGAPWLYGLFFVGYFFFFIMMTIHAGSFLASYLTTTQMKRVSSLIYAGIPVGNIIGGVCLIALLDVIPAEWLLLDMAVAYFVAILILWRLSRMMSPLVTAKSRARGGALAELGAATRLFRQSSFLRYLTLGMIAFVLVSKTLEYLYQGLIYPAAYPDLTDRAAFFAKYEIAANIVALLIQLLLAPRLLSWLGVGAGNILHPLLLLGASCGLLFHFGLWAGIIGQFVNQEMRNGVKNPVYNLLFNAIPAQLWGASKAFLNGIVFPASTVVVSIGLVIAQQTWPAEQQQSILATFAIAVAVIGVLLVFPQWRQYNNGILSLLRTNSLDSDMEGAHVRGLDCQDEIRTILRTEEEGRYGVAIQLIALTRAEQFVPRLGKIFAHTSDYHIQRQIATVLAEFRNRGSLQLLESMLDRAREPATIALLLQQLRGFRAFALGPQTERFLLHPYPQVFVEAAVCLLSRQDHPKQQVAKKKLLSNAALEQRPSDRVHFLEAFGRLGDPAFRDQIAPFISHSNAKVRAAALRALYALDRQVSEHQPELYQNALRDPANEVRLAALEALADAPELGNCEAVVALLEQASPIVANAAIDSLRLHMSEARSALLQVLNDSQEPVRKRQRALALVFELLSSNERQTLLAQAELALAHYLSLQQLHFSIVATWPEPHRALLAKATAELSDAQLQWVLVVIGQVGREPGTFEQRVRSGLNSDDRVRRANAMEALANTRESQLANHLLQIFDDPASTADAAVALLRRQFPDGPDDSDTPLEERLLATQHPVLSAAVWYQREQRGECHRDDWASLAPNARTLLLNEHEGIR